MGQNNPSTASAETATALDKPAQTHETGYTTAHIRNRAKDFRNDDSLSAPTTQDEEAAEDKFDVRKAYEMTFEDEGLPFKDELLFEAMRWPPPNAPYIICNHRLLSWLQTDDVLAILKAWKTHVVDQDNRRLFIEEGFALDERTADDTIYTLNGLCSSADPKADTLPDCAFEATAATVVKLLTTEDQWLSPFEHMVKLGNAVWCFEVLIRLLITIFCDMRDTKSSYFMQLLRGPKVPRAPHQRRGRRLRFIDNRARRRPIGIGELHKISKKSRKRKHKK